MPDLTAPFFLSDSAYMYHRCAIDSNGVVCWGNNEFGQTDVPLLQNPSYVSTGYQNTCTLDDFGVEEHLFGQIHCQ